MAAALIVLTGILAAAPAARADPPGGVLTTLVSRVGLTGPGQNGQSFQGPSISGDGRYVLFFSEATNLDPVSGGGAHVYRKDLATGATLLVSRADGLDGAPQQGLYARMSRNGAHVCFIAQGPAGEQLWTRDITAGRTHVIPGSAIDVEHGFNTIDFTGHSCAISHDGHTVVYNTIDSHDPMDTNGVPDVYEYTYAPDFSSGTWSLASQADGPGGAVGNGPSRNPTMTPDGRYVFFWSMASNLVAGDSNGASDVFRRDMVAGRTELVSAADGTTNPAAARTGFSSQTDPVASDDGNLVAFSSTLALSPGAGSGGRREVFERNVATHSTTLVSRASGSAGEASRDDSQDPDISPDGRYVSFDSFGGALDPSAYTGPGADNVYIRDIVGGRTSLVSRASGVFGAGGDNYSFGSAMSGDRGRVAFVSRARNFAPEATVLGNTYVRDSIGSFSVLPAALPVGPSVSGVVLPKLTFTSSTRAPAAPRGSMLRFKLAEFSQVSIRIERVAPRTAGRRAGATARRVLRVLGTLSLPLGLEGRNAVAFNGVLGGRALRPGRYRAVFQVRDLARRSRTKAVRFRVRAARRRRR